MEEESTTVNSNKWIRLLLWFTLVGLIASLGVFGYGFLQVWQLNSKLTHKIVNLQLQLQQTQQQIHANQSAIVGLQSLGEQAKTLAIKQEQLLAEWQVAQKGNLTRWYVAEAEYLVRLAQDHVQFLQNISQAKAMLLRADQILGTITDPDLMAVRQSLASDISHIQAIPELNLTAIYSQLNLLNSQLDQLPLPSQPIPNKDNVLSDYQKTTSSSWLKTLMDKSMQGLSKIVIVRYNNGNQLPLVMPEAKAYLYQNLHAQMESMMWAVLHRNNTVYQESLVRMIAWIKTYYVQEALPTQNMLNDLVKLQSISLQPEVSVNFNATLALFDSYLRKA